ncbi:ATP-dependent RNA helicase HrpB [Actinobaculum suis]|uniref:ATP-dependent RNA helicase HrpB n=1 Tax=Actinobaculum suis TaxID=1657 RepID=A0A7Z8Y778_9ACTO|nr:ATP-dependent helicase C-terminal domain-containing protein [Actinobaculum suis]VDG75307.1 ATP-dependent RNA helicase HrpB [Actinobaculum suis]
MPRSLCDLLREPPALPVATQLADVWQALEESRGLAVIEAPPGTGKTTLIPPLVATWVAGDPGAAELFGDKAAPAFSQTQAGPVREATRVLVMQPRRVAARAAARRIAALLGEPIGKTVGFAVRGENRTSAQTQIEMVTPGVLVRRLQADPELPGVDAIILDEIHERHLDADIALAFALDVRAALRPDLALIAMSATLNTAEITKCLASAAGEAASAAGQTESAAGSAPSEGSTHSEGGVPSEGSVTSEGGVPSEGSVTSEGGVPSEGAVTREGEAKPQASSNEDGGNVGVETETGDSGVRAVRIQGEVYPLAVRYAAPGRGAEPLGTIGRDGAIGVRREFLGHVAATARRALTETTGNILVFVPGRREVETVAGLLAGKALASEVLASEVRASKAVEVLQLHGSLDAAAQDYVLSAPENPGKQESQVTGKQQQEVPAGGGQAAPRRIIVSTSIAESSLTVPGVSVVVDSGLSRRPHTDYASGISGLVTVLESQAEGEQRAGRAARLGPGTVYRVMAESTWARLADQAAPEITTADLTDFALQMAVWGTPRGEGLTLLTAPPAPALSAAEGVLQDLGLLGPEGKALPEARVYARMPMDVRIARGVLTGAADPRIGPRRAAQIGAMLALEPRLPGADLSSWRRVMQGGGSGRGGSRGGSQAHLAREWRQQTSRLEKEIQRAGGTGSRAADRSSSAPLSEVDATALIVAAAYPDRIARARPSSNPARPSARYVLTGGAGAVLPEDSPLIGEEWLAISSLTTSPGRADAMIRAAIPIAEADALQAGKNMARTTTDVELTQGKRKRLRAEENDWLGAIHLRRRTVDKVPREAARAWLEKAVADGSLPLEFSREGAELRERLQFLHDALGDPWPNVSRETLAARLDELAGPELDEFVRGGSFASISAAQLMRLVPWEQAARLAEYAPAAIQIPTGENRRIDYSRARPTVRLRVQEAFGWKATPCIAGGKVPITLELLSPAKRPVAITDDLASFWAGPYADVRADMRGRYPKHPWPEDGANAEPTSRAKRSRISTRK